MLLYRDFLTCRRVTHSCRLQNTEGMPVLLSREVTKRQDFPAPSQSRGMTAIYTDCHVAAYLDRHYTFITLHLGEALSFPECHPFPTSACVPLLQEGRGHLLCGHRKPSRHDAGWLPREASTALIFGNHLIQGVPTENPHYRGSYTDFTSHGCRLSGSRLLKSLCWARDACWLAAGLSTGAL